MRRSHGQLLMAARGWSVRSNCSFGLLRVVLDASAMGIPCIKLWGGWEMEGHQVCSSSQMFSGEFARKMPPNAPSTFLQHNAKKTGSTHLPFAIREIFGLDPRAPRRANVDSAGIYGWLWRWVVGDHRTERHRRAECSHLLGSRLLCLRAQRRTAATRATLDGCRSPP